MSLFRKKTMSEEDPSDMDVVNVPLESDGFLKRLNNPAYVLIHPELFWQSVLVTFISSAIEMMICVLVTLYLATEIAAFMYMITNYGWLR